ncbi:hypothetical protein BO83DRAFT_421465 [Aspergillus eucalypticola CBS 122712]|uniref:Uncharacterized protein n=1 Tax=Aspergillus eucalypticola (strain CBS 122712 / IBT 29274) TaxID=1448314 RepID=A0A317UNL4_ASPEC|nr:uncharacterized protein BO83DRAFT_421465 [Aspergillus eucalypticola CBS 122712]PWY62728.1 hypothetical protein BO83DRAFT_421465 [Aspergillus eucalypticola CBS 122712]
MRRSMHVYNDATKDISSQRVWSGQPSLMEQRPAPAPPARCAGSAGARSGWIVGEALATSRWNYLHYHQGSSSDDGLRQPPRVIPRVSQKLGLHTRECPFGTSRLPCCISQTHVMIHRRICQRVWWQYLVIFGGSQASRLLISSPKQPDVVKDLVVITAMKRSTITCIILAETPIRADACLMPYGSKAPVKQGLGYLMPGGPTSFANLLIDSRQAFGLANGGWGVFSPGRACQYVCILVHMAYSQIRSQNICESDSRRILGKLLRRGSGWTLGELFVDRHRNTGSPCLLLVPDQVKPTGMTTYLNQSNRGPKMLVLLGAGPDLSDSGGCDWAACCRSRFRADPGPGPSFPPSCLEFTHLYGSIATSPASDAAGIQQ